jgi:hypothetical protein
MKEEIQTALERAGKYACYYLCLCQLADRKFDMDDVDVILR